MTDDATALCAEAERVEEWRREFLLNLNVPPEDAAWLARRRTVDVHLVEALIRRGASPAQAVRIVA